MRRSAGVIALFLCEDYPVRARGRAASIVALAIVGALALSGVVQASAATQNAAARDRTRVVVVHPVTRSGIARDYRVVTTRLHGQCVFASVVAAGQSYHCTSGNGLYDPCWADPTEKTLAVLCLPYSPFSQRLIRIRMDKRLPQVSSTHTVGGDLWAMVLADG